MVASVIATLGGIGHLRPAPGTWGSLVALPLAWALHVAGGFGIFLAATVAVALIGWWAVGRVTDGEPEADPAEIIIDELVGQWIALWPVSLGASVAGVPVTALWPGVVTAFIAFRLFDIWKPGPVGYADRMAGPAGVMLDDVVAGWIAALIVAALGVFFHLVLM